jgi:hypothetical protein
VCRPHTARRFPASPLVDSDSDHDVESLRPIPDPSLSVESDDAASAQTAPVYHRIGVPPRRFPAPHLAVSDAVVAEASPPARLAISPVVTPPAPHIVPLVLPPEALSLDFGSDDSDSDCIPCKGVFTNFDAVLKCLTNRLRPQQLLAKVREVVLARRQEHFILLLLEPGLAFEGIYALEPSLKGIRRVWGDTPEVIDDQEGLRFWMYNGITDRFVEQEEREFSPLTDAISM